jgi:hypothetical protein
MAKKILILAGSAALVAVCALLSRTLILEHEFDKTEDFFRENTGFQARLNLALNGDTAARLKYYRIPDEYHLDGAFSESYQDGLESQHYTQLLPFFLCNLNWVNDLSHDVAG